jgi:hypothetical protein
MGGLLVLPGGVDSHWHLDQPVKFAAQMKGQSTMSSSIITAAPRARHISLTPSTSSSPIRRPRSPSGGDASGNGARRVGRYADPVKTTM